MVVHIGRWKNPIFGSEKSPTLSAQERRSVCWQPRHENNPTNGTSRERVRPSIFRITGLNPGLRRRTRF
jgi:hypothetical protein